LRELHKRGVLSRFDLSDQMLSNINDQVTFLIRSCEKMRDTLVKLDQEVGSNVWNQLILFCNTHMKECMTLSSDETAEDLAIREAWKRFDPKQISIGRKKLHIEQ
jgi:hypothetical protein